MTNVDFDPEYADLRRGVLGGLNTAEDVDPDQAGRAMELEESTGVPSTYIAQDIQNFEAQHKESLSRSIINNSPILMQYVNQHPLNASVSQNDWGNLANTSDQYMKVHDATSDPWWKRYSYLLGRGAYGGTADVVGALGRVIGSENLTAKADKIRDAAQADMPLTDDEQAGLMAQILTGIGQMAPMVAGGLAAGAVGPEAGIIGGLGLGTITAAGIGGLQHGEEEAEEAEHEGGAPTAPFVGGAISGAALNLLPLGIVTRPWEQVAPGLINWGAAAFKRAIASGGAMSAVGEVSQALDAEMARWTYDPDAKYSPDASRMLANMAMGMTMGVGFDAIKAYIDGNQHIPLGLHPIPDRLIAESTKELQGEFDELIKSASKTDTPEHGPGGIAAFESYLKLHPDNSIGIPTEEIVKLYGDKAPEELSWVPDINRQLNTDEVRIPFADYLSHARQDPEMDKELHDFRRIGVNGYSLDDVKYMAQAQQAEQEQKEQLLETPETPRYLGGLVDSGAPVLDSVRKSMGLDRILPVDYNFWRAVPGNTGALEGRTDLGVTNPGAVVDMLYNSGNLRNQQYHVAIRTSGQTTGSQILQGLNFDKFAPEVRQLLSFFRDRGSEMAGNIPIYLVPEKEIERMRPKGQSMAAGFYEQWSDRAPQPYIVLNADSMARGSQEWMAHVVVHEMAHAATIREMKADPELQDIAKKLMGEMKAWLIKNEPDSYDPQRDKFYNGEIEYAFSVPDASEFVAQGWSQPQLMEAMSRAKISDDLLKRLGLPQHNNTVWDAIMQTVRNVMEKVFGKLPPTIMDGFLRWGERIRETQIGGKLPPVGPGTIPEPLEPPMPELFQDQNVLGYSKSGWEAIKKQLLDWKAKDDEFRIKKATEDAERKMTQFWKDKSAELEPEARAQVYQQNVIKADLFLRYGQLPTGEKLVRRRLNGEYLTDQQKRDLEQDYWQKGRGGLVPDEIAPNFGYRSGDEMISDLIGHSTDIRLNNSTPTQWLGKLVKDRLDWMMNDRYGSMKEDLLKDAKDHVLSQGLLHLAHQDTIRIATKAGLQSPMTAEQFRQAAIDELNQTRRGNINSEQLIDMAGRIGRKVEEASAKGDWGEAYRLAQRRQIVFNKAYEMRDFEDLEAKGKKAIKGHVSREPDAFKNPDAAEFHDWIQLFMNKYGMNANLGKGGVDNILSVMKTSRGFSNFREFVDNMSDPMTGFGKTIPAPDFLLDADFKFPQKLKDLTVGETKSLWQTLISMDKIGREATKWFKHGQMVTRDEAISELLPGITRFKEVDLPVTPTTMSTALHKLRLYDAVSRIPERLFNRFDGNDPRGAWNQYIVRPITEMANHEATEVREIGADSIKNGTPKDYKKLMQPPPMLQRGGRPLIGFTRSNMYAIALNMGNASNWFKMYAGRGMDEATANQLRQWVMTNMTKEEWKWVQGVWDVLQGIKDRLIDPAYLKTVGFPPDNIPPTPITLNDGTVLRGGYYPLMSDDVDIGKGSVSGLVKIPAGKNFFSLSIPNPHARERTGALYPLSLSTDHLPDRIHQMIHDAVFREGLGDVGKILQDTTIQRAIITHYGPEYMNTIKSWLTRMAHQTNFNSAAAVEGNKMSEFLRQNMMSFYVGWNIGTVLKHAPTALINSARMIGTDNLLRGYYNMYRTNEQTGETWSKFIDQNSEEIQRRTRDWAERAGISANDLQKATLRDKIIMLGSRPVAFSDMLSAKPMWLGAYFKALDEGQTTEESIFEADRAVRYAHGSTAPTNLPEIATGGGIHAWMTSLYHFFGTMLQNRMEIAFKLNDMYNMGRQGELKRAAAVLPLVVADVFAYVVWPTAVEEYVTGLGRDDRRGWGSRLAWATAGGIANSAIYARDIVHSLEYGLDQGGGFLDSVVAPLAQTARDVSKAVKGKEQIYNAKFAGNLIQDLINLTTYKYGTPREVGNLAKYGWDTATGVEVPHTGLMKDWYQWGDVGRGLTHGTQKLSVVRQ